MRSELHRMLPVAGECQAVLLDISAPGFRWQVKTRMFEYDRPALFGDSPAKPSRAWKALRAPNAHRAELGFEVATRRLWLLPMVRGRNASEARSFSNWDS